MGWLRQAVVDLRPLRRREFRLLFGAQAVSLAGSERRSCITKTT